MWSKFFRTHYVKEIIWSQAIQLVQEMNQVCSMQYCCAVDRQLWTCLLFTERVSVCLQVAPQWSHVRSGSEKVALCLRLQRNRASLHPQVQRRSSHAVPPLPLLAGNSGMTSLSNDIYLGLMNQILAYSSRNCTHVGVHVPGKWAGVILSTLSCMGNVPPLQGWAAELKGGEQKAEYAHLFCQCPLLFLES